MDVAWCVAPCVAKFASPSLPEYGGARLQVLSSSLVLAGLQSSSLISGG